jgi:hypothetical protein
MWACKKHQITNLKKTPIIKFQVRSKSICYLRFVFWVLEFKQGIFKKD